MTYRQQVSGVNYTFDGLVELMAKATPLRSGDQLAGCAAEHDAERAAAAWVLADLPLDTFLKEEIVPYETDEVTRLIFDSHDRQAFSAISHLTVGGFRDWLLETASRDDSAARIAAIAPGLTPEMAAATSKIMRNQDLIAVAAAVQVSSAFRGEGHPPRPTDRHDRDFGDTAVASRFRHCEVLTPDKRMGTRHSA
jgi:ethanolamine ammonia-lyase large subunit